MKEELKREFVGNTSKWNIEDFEEPKQETLEEAAFTEGEERFNVFKKGILEPNRFDFVCGFTDGAKFGAEWQAKRSYSEEEVKIMFNRYNEFISHHDPEEWQPWIDKQFKKK